LFTKGIINIFNVMKRKITTLFITITISRVLSFSVFSFGAVSDSSVVKASLGISFTDITGTALPSSPGAGSHCATFADITGDGLPDLYVTMYYTANISDLFFVNSALTVFTEEAASRNINDYDGGSHGAVFADLDNDGDFDLINGTTVLRRYF